MFRSSNYGADASSGIRHNPRLDSGILLQVHRTSAGKLFSALRMPGKPISLLLLISTLSTLVLIVGRQVVGAGMLDGDGVGPVPLWATMLICGLAIAASALAWLGWRNLGRMRRKIDRLGADATRVMLGEYCLETSEDGEVSLEPISGAVNRLAGLISAAESMIADRDRQLETIRSLSNAAYWETDERGRFVRVEFEPSWPRGSRLALLGSLVFEGTEPLDEARWEAARSAVANRRPFQDLPVARLSTSARSIRVIESGTPRFGSDGRFLGYAGITRLMGAGGFLEEEAAIRAAVLNSRECTLVLGMDGDSPQVRWMNPAAERFFECTAAECAAITLDKILDAGQDQHREALRFALSEHEPLQMTLGFRNRFGERIEAVARVSPVPATSSLAVLSIDPRELELLELRRLTSEHDAIRQDLADQAARLDLRTREQEAFLYGVSHDLRAPLRMVEGFALLLHKDHRSQLDPVGRVHLEKMLTGCSQMDRMIMGLLSLARTSAQPLITLPVDLSRIAREVIDALRHQQPDRQVEVRIADSLNAWGDPTLIRRLLENLLGNAWKYTGRRNRARIELDCIAHEDGRQVFTVSDNGAGFDMRVADKLFSPFQRLHAESDFPGTGLGLATSQRIVQRHGGEIWAESAPDRGSRFSFTLGPAPHRRNRPPAGQPASNPVALPDPESAHL